MPDQLSKSILPRPRRPRAIADSQVQGGQKGGGRSLSPRDPTGSRGGGLLPARWLFGFSGSLMLLIGGSIHDLFPLCLGYEFRIENAVYDGFSESPTAQTTTVFTGGKVYDFLHQPEEIVIFDPAQRRFVLINPSLRIRTELRMEQVAAFINTLRSWASQQEDPFLRFSATPDLFVRRGPTGTSLLFESPHLTYHVEVDRPPDPQIAKQYAEFSDWYSQLNTMVTPGARLPFPRLYVNKVLLEEGFVPLRVELHLKEGNRKGSKVTVIRSHHNFFYRLLESERSRAGQADEFALIFRPVGFVEYQKKLLQLARQQ